MWGALFPGQGSQTVGMGQYLVENFKAARLTFEEADEALHFRLSRLCLSGPDSDLNLTENTQPALLATSVATYRACREIIDIPICAGAGHSVGEYAACVTAGAIDFAQALRAVRERGRAMQVAVPVGEGAMIAVMGLSEQQIDAVCSWARAGSAAGVLEAANFNAPGQVVLSGTAAACNWLRENFTAAVAGEIFGETPPRFKFIPLNVSAPFHCSLMKSAEITMAEILESMPFADAQWEIVQNVTAEGTRAGATLRANLIRQISGAVRWTRCISKLQSLGITKFVEFGAGKVLSGLSKKIDSEGLTTFNTNSLDDIHLLERALKAER